MKILSIKDGEVKFPGGINTTVMEINNNLAKRGHRCTVITTNPLDLTSEESYNGFKILRFKSLFEKFYGLSYEAYFFMKKYLKILNPDIIHVHSYHGLFCSEIIYLIKRIDPDIPIVFSPHLDIYRSSLAGKYLWNLFNLFGKISFSKCSYIISCSNFEANNIINDFKVSKDKLSIINHGIDDFSNIEDLHTKEGLNLIYAGHLVDRKGVDFVLESLNSLINDLGFKNVSLTIIGNGPEKNKLLNLSKKLNIEEHIIWNSFLPREELISEIRSSDILILLSKSEAYGIIIAESLALGTPCIVANRTALSEFINENGCFGVNYPPDPKEVADLVLKIYKNNIRAGPLSKKIRTWNEVVKDYEKIYFNLLAGE